MKLQVNDRYRIKTDKYCWHIQERRGKKRPEWRSVAYYSNAQTLAKGLAHRMLRDSKATTLAEALEDAQRIAAQLTRALGFRVEVDT